MKARMGLLLAMMWISTLSAQTGHVALETSLVISDNNNISPEAGTIRWTGSDFEGWNGDRWVSLTNNQISSTVTDIDGNIYKTVRIGSREWMTENLKVSRFNDGTAIRQVGQNNWGTTNDPAYSWYNHDTDYDQNYGKLYNGYVLQASLSGKNVCPVGWVVPDEPLIQDFLIQHLGGSIIAGGKLKMINSDLWNDPNIEASNESWFSAIPSGFLDQNGVADALARESRIWIFEFQLTDPKTLNLTVNSGRVFIGNANKLPQLAGSQNFGAAIRCVKT